MMTRLVSLLLLAHAIVNPAGVGASDKKAAPPAKGLIQVDIAKPATLAQIEENAKNAADREAKNSDEQAAPLDQEQAEYNHAYWKYQRYQLDHSRKVYDWQHKSSIIIFFVVILLVLVGVLFSWLQFRAAAFKGESEELKASMQGVQITSSTLGVVILVLSMCFFYLYLRYVYPVNVNEALISATETRQSAAH